MKRYIIALFLLTSSVGALAQDSIKANVPTQPKVTVRNVVTDTIHGSRYGSGVLNDTVFVSGGFYFPGTGKYFIGNSEVDSSVFATRYWVNQVVDSLGDLTNITYPDSSVQNSSYLQANQRANLIRINAGVPLSVVYGNNAAVGLSDSSLLRDTTRFAISSEADIIAIAVSGTGTQSDPYVISNFRFDNSESSASNGGFVWNDPSADYYIKLSNCILSGYASAQISHSAPSTLYLDRCVIYGDGTYTAGANTAYGAEVTIGGLIVTNTRFDGLGNYHVYYTGTKKLKLTNCLFTKVIGTASGTAPYNILHNAANADSVIITNCEHEQLSSRGLILMQQPTNIVVDKCYLKEFIYTADAITTFSSSTPNSYVSYRFINNYFYSDSINRGIYFSSVASNLYVEHNTFDFLPRVQDRQIISTSGLTNNVFIRFNKFNHRGTYASLGAAATFAEPVFLVQAANTEVAYNWTVKSQADVYEHFNPRHSNYVHDNVADYAIGQIVDFFNQPAFETNEQYGNFIYNIYGATEDVGVLNTNCKGITVHDVYVKTLRDSSIAGVKTSMVQFEQRNYNADSIPYSCYFMGGNYDSTLSANGRVFSLRGDVNDVLNTAIWVQGGKIYTYNLDSVSQLYLGYLDTVSSFVSGDFVVYNTRRKSTNMAFLYNESSNIKINSGLIRDDVSSPYSTFSSKRLSDSISSGFLSLNPSTLLGMDSRPAINILQTWNTTGSPTGILANFTNTSSGATTKLMDLRVNGTSRISFASNMAAATFDVNGLVVANTIRGNDFQIGTNKSRIYSPVNGNITFLDNAATGFNMFQFGGTTTAFPSIKRVGKNIHFRLADDSDSTSIAADTVFCSVLAAGNVPSTFAQGIYLPADSGGFNVDGVTMDSAMYTRIGNMVTVSGTFTVDPTTTATPTGFYINLPILTNVVPDVFWAGGTFAAYQYNESGAFLMENNQSVLVQFFPTEVGATVCSYSFTYRLQ